MDTPDSADDRLLSFIRENLVKIVLTNLNVEMTNRLLVKCTRVSQFKSDMWFPLVNSAIEYMLINAFL
jgi:hypothetical protein